METHPDPERRLTCPLCSRTELTFLSATELAEQPALDPSRNPSWSIPPTLKMYRCSTSPNEHVCCRRCVVKHVGAQLAAGAVEVTCPVGHLACDHRLAAAEINTICPISAMHPCYQDYLLLQVLDAAKSGSFDIIWLSLGCGLSDCGAGGAIAKPGVIDFGGGEGTNGYYYQHLPERLQRLAANHGTRVLVVLVDSTPFEPFEERGCWDAIPPPDNLPCGYGHRVHSTLAITVVQFAWGFDYERSTPILRAAAAALRGGGSSGGHTAGGGGSSGSGGDGGDGGEGGDDGGGGLWISDFFTESERRLTNASKEDMAPERMCHLVETSPGLLCFRARDGALSAGVNTATPSSANVGGVKTPPLLPSTPSPPPPPPTPPPPPGEALTSVPASTAATSGDPPGSTSSWRGTVTLRGVIFGRDVAATSHEAVRDVIDRAVGRIFGDYAEFGYTVFLNKSARSIVRLMPWEDGAECPTLAECGVVGGDVLTVRREKLGKTASRWEWVYEQYT